MSDTLAALLLHLVPLRHSKADRRIAEDTLALIQDMVMITIIIIIIIIIIMMIMIIIIIIIYDDDEYNTEIATYLKHSAYSLH